MKLLNLGCGQRFHSDWTNIDFISGSECVLAHNLLNGIPFPENEFDVIYHSHVLEHFSREEGKKFIAECYRVLKPGGIIRIAVPDLEQIARHYLKNLEGALQGDDLAAENYKWMMIEMYDQVVREKSGGMMAEHLVQEQLRNEDFIYSRIGEEFKSIRKNHMKKKGALPPSDKKKWNKFFRISSYVHVLRKLLFPDYMARLKQQQQILDLGIFRKSGEIHQWMYDRYSIGELLKDHGFSSAEVKTAFESRIPSWEKYQLDSLEGKVHKPDSIFVEAVK